MKSQRKVRARTREPAMILPNVLSAGSSYERSRSDSNRISRNVRPALFAAAQSPLPPTLFTGAITVAVAEPLQPEAIRSNHGGRAHSAVDVLLEPLQSEAIRSNHGRRAHSAVDVLLEPLRAKPLRVGHGARALRVSIGLVASEAAVAVVLGHPRRAPLLLARFLWSDLDRRSHQRQPAAVRRDQEQSEAVRGGGNAMRSGAVRSL